MALRLYSVLTYGSMIVHSDTSEQYVWQACEDGNCIVVCSVACVPESTVIIIRKSTVYGFVILFSHIIVVLDHCLVYVCRIRTRVLVYHQ